MSDATSVKMVYSLSHSYMLACLAVSPVLEASRKLEANMNIRVLFAMLLLSAGPAMAQPHEFGGCERGIEGAGVYFSNENGLLRVYVGGGGINGSNYLNRELEITKNIIDGECIFDFKSKRSTPTDYFINIRVNSVTRQSHVLDYHFLDDPIWLVIAKVNAEMKGLKKEEDKTIPVKCKFSPTFESNLKCNL